MTIRGSITAKFNRAVLDAHIERALGLAAEAFGAEASKQIATVQWDWPNSTLRFTSLFMNGTGDARPRLFSPPTTAAGASNTLGFKKAAGVQGQQNYGGVRIPEGPRDTVDTGALLKSQQAPVIENGELRIVWNVPYAELVRRGGDYGEYINPRGELVNAGRKPGRDWIAKTFEVVPPLKTFAQAWQAT